MKIDRNLIILTVLILVCGISLAATITYYYSNVSLKVAKFDSRFNVSFKSVKYSDLNFSQRGKIWIMSENYTEVSNSFRTELRTNPDYMINMHIARVSIDKVEDCKIFAESWLRNERINEKINISAVIAYAKLNDSCETTLGDLLNYIFNVNTELEFSGKKLCVIAYKECSPSWKKCYLNLNVTNEKEIFTVIMLPPSKYNETLIFSTAIYSD